MKKLFIFAMLLCAVIAHAAVVNVPADYPTIKDAYTAATAGDEIVVAAGVYTDAYIDFTKAITIKGANAGVAGTAARGAESVWRSGGATIRLKCDNVVIDGFRIEPTSNRWLDNNHSANGFQFINNIVDCADAGSNVFQTEGAVSYRDWVIQNNYFNITDHTMLYLGGGGSAADFTNLLIKGNKIEGTRGCFIFWTAGVPANFRFHENECINICTMNAGKVGDLSVRGNTFTNSFYTAFQCGIEGGEVVDNYFNGGDPWCPYGGNLFELWGGEWGTPISNNVMISGNTFVYNNSADCPVHGPRLRAGADAASIIFQNNKWIDNGALPTAFAIRNQGAGTLYVGINDWNSPIGYAAHEFYGDIEFPGAWIYDGKIYYTPSIGVTVWNDVNLNGVIDEGEKGLEGIEVSLPKMNKVTKHLTREKGQCTFKNLEFGEFTLIVDDSKLSSGIVCTTGELAVTVIVDENNNFPQVEIGLAGDGLENLSGDDVIDPRPQAVTAAPNDLVFVEGTLTGTDGKHDMGWPNAVDKDVEGNDGTVWAMADAATGEDVPWAIFEFGDQGVYKFNYAKFQTDNGTDDDAAKNAYQVTKIEVLVSMDGMMADDFESVGIFNLKYGTDKMQWCTLDDYVTAKYVKLRLLNPVVEGKWTQIVEFALDTGDKTGPVAANDSNQFVVVPESTELLNNYPNPFNPTTTIEYAIPEAAQVRLTVYDVTGKQVAELVNSFQSSGSYSVQFDASDLPSGMYFCTVQAGSFNQTRRMMLVK